MPKLRPFVGRSNGSEPFDAKGGNHHNEPNDMDVKRGYFTLFPPAKRREREREREKKGQEIHTTQGKEKLRYLFQLALRNTLWIGKEAKPPTHCSRERTEYNT